MDQRDSLAREIDEELRREQLLKLWEKYGTYALVAAALVIVGIGGFKYYDYRRNVAAEAAGAKFTAAVREAAQDKKSESLKALEQVAASGPAGYALLARLKLAAADRDAGKTTQAAAAFEDIAKQRGTDPLLADYAQLQAAMLKLDSADWTDMQNRLNGLLADGNAWRFSARELLGLAARKAGKIEEARTQFQRLLGDRDAPPSIGKRARIMLAMITESELANEPSNGAGAAAPSSPSEQKTPTGEGKQETNGPAKSK